MHVETMADLEPKFWLNYSFGLFFIKKYYIDPLVF